MEIKDRFTTLQKTHVKRWQDQNPTPVMPAVKTILRELRAGRCTLDEKQLARALKPKNEEDWGRDDPGFLEVLTTPSIEKHRLAVKERECAFEAFKVLVDEVKLRYQDQVLFDHANAFVALTDFQRWDWATDDWRKGAAR